MNMQEKQDKADGLDVETIFGEKQRENIFDSIEQNQNDNTQFLDKRFKLKESLPRDRNNNELILKENWQSDDELDLELTTEQLHDA